MDFIKSLFEVLTLPCLCVLLLHGVYFLKLKVSNMEGSADKEMYESYLDAALDAIYKSVVKVNQTFVDTLKAEGNFTAEAQKEAFQTACETALKIMGEQAVMYLDNAMDDFGLWLQVQIEAAVKLNK